MEAKSHIVKHDSEEGELQPCGCGFSFKGCCDCDGEDIGDDVNGSTTNSMDDQGMVHLCF